MAHLAPMNNGIGRFMCQLKRLTLQYCKNGGSSKGMREYINRHVVPFAKKNPYLTVYARQRPGRHPRIIAEYPPITSSMRCVIRAGTQVKGLAHWTKQLSFTLTMNGNSRVVSVKNETPREIKDRVSLLRSSSGIKTAKLKKWWHTDNPSIQGNWTPFLNK